MEPSHTICSSLRPSTCIADRRRRAARGRPFPGDCWIAAFPEPNSTGKAARTGELYPFLQYTDRGKRAAAVSSTACAIIADALPHAKSSGGSRRRLRASVAQSPSVRASPNRPARGAREEQGGGTCDGCRHRMGAGGTEREGGAEGRRGKVEREEGGRLPAGVEEEPPALACRGHRSFSPWRSLEPRRRSGYLEEGCHRSAELRHRRSA